MSAIDQIREIMAANPDLEAAELRLAFGEILKQKKKRTNAVQKAMRTLVGDFKTSSLTRLRKELKLAYEEAHKNDEPVSESTPKTAYREFVKEQTAILREDIAFAFSDQRERMIEIGKRWKARKLASNEPTPLPELTPEPNASEPIAPIVIGPPTSRRITRSRATNK